MTEKIVSAKAAPIKPIRKGESPKKSEFFSSERARKTAGMERKLTSGGIA